jgi:hypothetical protein
MLVQRRELLLTLKGQMDRHSGVTESVTKLRINVAFIVLNKPIAFEATFWLNELSRENKKVAKKYSHLL